MKLSVPSLAAIMFTIFPVAGDDLANVRTAPAEEILSIDNGIAKIGIDKSKGASITWLSWDGYPKNTVNIHDPGRLIQQSYYAGKRLDRTTEGQTQAWSPWSWNPIQGGGTGSWASVTRFEKTEEGKSLYAETIPKLWDMPNEDAEAIMKQWTAFETDMPETIVVRNQIIVNRKPGDPWGPAANTPQEVPACYFTRNFDTFRVYLGNGKWNTVTQKPGPPWGHAAPPLKIMACFNKEGQGVAIFSPTSGETWNFGPHVAVMTDDPKGSPCVHVAPVSRVNLGPQSTYEYRYWLVVGDQKRISHSLDKLLKLYSEERGTLTN